MGFVCPVIHRCGRECIALGADVHIEGVHYSETTIHGRLFVWGLDRFANIVSDVSSAFGIQYPSPSATGTRVKVVKSYLKTWASPGVGCIFLSSRLAALHRRNRFSGIGYPLSSLPASSRYSQTWICSLLLSLDLFRYLAKNAVVVNAPETFLGRRPVEELWFIRIGAGIEIDHQFFRLLLKAQFIPVPRFEFLPFPAEESRLSRPQALVRLLPTSPLRVGLLSR